MISIKVKKVVLLKVRLQMFCRQVSYFLRDLALGMVTQQNFAISCHFLKTFFLSDNSDD
jgi:hypothetical protein